MGSLIRNALQENARVDTALPPNRGIGDFIFAGHFSPKRFVLWPI